MISSTRQCKISHIAFKVRVLMLFSSLHSSHTHWRDNCARSAYASKEMPRIFNKVPNLLTTMP